MKGSNIYSATSSQKNIADGQAVTCDPREPEVYRYENGTIRHYPDPDIASSWDKNWLTALLIDCTGLRKGEQMQMKTTISET